MLSADEGRKWLQNDLRKLIGDNKTLLSLDCVTAIFVKEQNSKEGKIFLFQIMYMLKITRKM